jgi:hypothetical protein
MDPIANSNILSGRNIFAEFCNERKQNTVTYYGVTIGFLDHLYTRLGTTSNCSAIANLHTLNKLLTLPLSRFQPAVSSPAVSWQWLLTVEILQLHALKSCLNGGSLPTASFLTHFRTEQARLPQLSSLQPLCTAPVGNTVSNGTSIVACVSIAAGTYLQSRCLETNVVSEPFACNFCLSDSTVLALSKYATERIKVNTDL